MKFSGELKFPEIDHPGVPVSFLIEGTQAELIVEGESLGRWSLYDIHARRLVASAFQIDLNGTEVTFVADDPVDFAYRGVEHMAETWAGIKSKRIAARTVAVRKSRSGAVPSRIDDLKAAMEANLEAQTTPRHIAGEMVMPDAPPPADSPTTVAASDWDQRDTEGAIPLVGSDPAPPPVAPPSLEPGLSDEALHIEEEKRRIAEEWAKLEDERRKAEQQEANRIEAFRIEMQRLEAERAELRRQAEQLPEPARAPEPEPEPVFAAEPEPVFAAEPEPVFAAEPEPAEESAETGMVDLSDLEETVSAPPQTSAPAPAPMPAPATAPEPALAAVAAGRDRSGLMGAVRSAFKTGAKDHEHQFIEAPGGIGIVRYVCEECGYVSISA